MHDDGQLFLIFFGRVRVRVSRMASKPIVTFVTQHPHSHAYIPGLYSSRRSDIRTTLQPAQPRETFDKVPGTLRRTSNSVQVEDVSKTFQLEIRIHYIGSKTSLSHRPRPYIAPTKSELLPTTYVETPIQLGTNRAASQAIGRKDAQEALEQRSKNLSFPISVLVLICSLSRILDEQ